VSSLGERVPSAADSLAIGGELRRPRGGRPRSEQALIHGVLAGSEADLEALFRRHWPRAYRTAFLIVHDHAAAEDIAQEAFLAAIRRLDRFDRRPVRSVAGRDRRQPRDRLGPGADRAARGRGSVPGGFAQSARPAGRPLLG
jgi:sigma-70-like protein